eukprot:5951999-Pleurochrysis_carterae.AAC.1
MDAFEPLGRNIYNAVACIIRTPAARPWSPARAKLACPFRQTLFWYCRGAIFTGGSCTTSDFRLRTTYS